MNQDVLYFFDGHSGALSLYQAFERRVLAEIEQVEVKVQKTQIAFPTGITLPLYRFCRCGGPRNGRRITLL